MVISHSTNYTLLGLITVNTNCYTGGGCRLWKVHALIYQHWARLTCGCCARVFSVMRRCISAARRSRGSLSGRVFDTTRPGRVTMVRPPCHPVPRCWHRLIKAGLNDASADGQISPWPPDPICWRVLRNMRWRHAPSSPIFLSAFTSHCH